MRGRLINPFWVELAQLDTQHTQYDPDFMEPAILPPATGEGPGTQSLVERPTYRVPAQIEPATVNALEQVANGGQLSSKIVIVCHCQWLEENGFVDAAGNATVRQGTRLVAIYTPTGDVAFTAVEPVYVTQVMPAGFGFGGTRNLLFVTFESSSKEVDL